MGIALKQIIYLGVKGLILLKLSDVTTIFNLFSKILAEIACKRRFNKNITLATQ
jgi:hypothetical protein